MWYSNLLRLGSRGTQSRSTFRSVPARLLPLPAALDQERAGFSAHFSACPGSLPARFLYMAQPGVRVDRLLPLLTAFSWLARIAGGPPSSPPWRLEEILPAPTPSRTAGGGCHSG